MTSLFLHILPLFLILAIRATAAPPPTSTDTVSLQKLNRLQELCSHTEQSKLCVDALLTFPETAKADDQMLAALSIRYAANNAAETAFYIGGQAQDAGSSNPKLQQCLADCIQLVEDAVDQLNSCTEFIEDKKSHRNVADMMNAALMDATTCNKGCEEVAGTAEAKAVKEKVDRFFDVCNNALVLTRLLK